MKDLKKEFYKKFVTVEDDWERGEPSVYSNEELELAYFDDVDPEEIWEWFEQKFLEERKKTLEEVEIDEETRANQMEDMEEYRKEVLPYDCSEKSSNIETVDIWRYIKQHIGFGGILQFNVEDRVELENMVVDIRANERQRIIDNVLGYFQAYNLRKISKKEFLVLVDMDLSKITKRGK